MAIAIEERFVVEAPVEQVWAYFEDLPRVVPCLPGAELVRVVDDSTYEGKVGLRVGPVRAQFLGTVHIESVDPEARTMALVARGTQQGAAGRAEAQVAFQLQPASEGSTEVTVNADVSISGKLAQLGGGMIQSVSRQLFRKFADCVREEILVGNAGSGDGSQTEPKGGVRATNE